MGNLILQHTAMKVFVVLLLVALALADDHVANCTVAATTSPKTSGCTVVDLSEWTPLTVTSAANACTMTNYTADDAASTNVFVLAIRPGSDSTGNITLPRAFATVGGANVGCAQIQSDQEDDMDYGCYGVTSFASQTAYYVTLMPNGVEVSTTIEVYSGFSEGTTGACASSYVSSSGSSIWLWVIIGVIVVLAVVIIAGAIGGFLYMKKKKSSYQLYEDA